MDKQYLHFFLFFRLTLEQSDFVHTVEQKFVSSKDESSFDNDDTDEKDDKMILLQKLIRLLFVWLMIYFKVEDNRVENVLFEFAKIWY